MGKRSRIVVLGVLILGMLGVGGPVAHALTSVESCFYHAINRERARVGRPSLRLMSDLTTIARRHSRRMASDHTIYHNNNLGNEVSGHWWAAGENVGMGDSCQAIHDAFMGSPGHRSNIIDRDYNQVGVGVAFDEDGTVYVTEDFAGRPSGAPRRIVHRAAPAKAAAKPPVRRRVAPVSPVEPRTVVVLLRLLGLDASRVDKTSGEAMGV
jgi:hypothetical protein